jgi:hypothetical protein
LLAQSDGSTVPARMPAVSATAATRSVAFDLALAVPIGGLAYALSCWLVPPNDIAAGFGLQWQMMAKAPLELPGQLPHRILMPLLANWCGCGGDREFLWFVRGLGALLLVVVCLFCRRRGASLVDSALVTVAVALTAAIQMYKQHWVGYADPLQYSLFFVAWLCAGRPLLFWVLFLVNLLTHELAVFLLPWLLFIRREASRLGRSPFGRRDVVYAGVALGVYAAFYLWVQSRAPQQLFSAAYFASHPLFPGGSVTVWLLALVHYVVAFGPILAVVAWHQQACRDRDRWHLWLVGLGIFAIFGIAFDWQRHTNLIILPFVLASVRFLAAGHRAIYVVLLGAGAAAMQIAKLRTWHASSWPMHLIVDQGMEQNVVIIDNSSGALNITFGSLENTLRNWLPAVWPTLWPLLVIFAAIWLAGAWLGRREPRVRSAS